MVIEVAVDTSFNQRDQREREVGTHILGAHNRPLTRIGRTKCDRAFALELQWLSVRIIETHSYPRTRAAEADNGERDHTDSMSALLASRRIVRDQSSRRQVQSCAASR